MVSPGTTLQWNYRKLDLSLWRIKAGTDQVNLAEMDEVTS